MKIIDLLNKIADGEEVPKKIKFNDYIYTAKGNAIENFVDYCSEEDEWCFNHYVRYENLNDEVEIIEEDKKIEKIKDILHIDDLIPPVDENICKIWTQTIKNHNKINELIDYINNKD